MTVFDGTVVLVGRRKRKSESVWREGAWCIGRKEGNGVECSIKKRKKRNELIINSLPSFLI